MVLEWAAYSVWRPLVGSPVHLELDDHDREVLGRLREQRVAADVPREDTLTEWCGDHGVTLSKRGVGRFSDAQVASIGDQQPLDHRVQRPTATRHAGRFSARLLCNVKVLTTRILNVLLTMGRRAVEWEQSGCAALS